MNEDRIYDKLDELGNKLGEVAVGVARLEEQIKDVPDLKTRVAALERWKWTAMGALGMASTSMGAQIYGAIKGV